MVLRAGKPNKFRLTIVVAALIWIVSGCSSKSARLPTYMQPELLYLNEKPYSRLYVEVDTVEGVEVPEKWLDTLKEFLSTHCSKPYGIEIVRDEPIPFDDIKDMPIGPASILCLDGPDPNNGSQPAYLHVFIYAKDKIFKGSPEYPHTATSFCPCAIFYNVDYKKSKQKKFVEFALQHEIGHILGLCKNPAHSDGSHCKNDKCLMYKNPGLFSTLGLYLGVHVNKALCTHCLNDLEAYKSETPDPNLTFEGPFLIRKEDGYSVASLPYCDILVLEPLEDRFNWNKSLIDLKNIVRGISYSECWKDKVIYTLQGIFNPDDTPLKNMGMYLEYLSKASKDPSPMVRAIAIKSLEKINQEQGN